MNLTKLLGAAAVGVTMSLALIVPVQAAEAQPDSAAQMKDPGRCSYYLQGQCMIFYNTYPNYDACFAAERTVVPAITNMAQCINKGSYANMYISDEVGPPG